MALRSRARKKGSWGVFDGPFAGVDQGTDWSGKGSIPALGEGTVTYVGSSSIIEGGNFPVVVYELAKPPALAPSRYVYVAENFRPSVARGDSIKLGDPIGSAPGSYPYIEVGFNSGPTGWNPVAPLYPDPHSPKPAGYAMQNLIGQLRNTGVPTVGGVPAAPQPGKRSRPGTGGGSGGGILGFFDSVGGDIGSAAGWTAAGAEGVGGAIGGAASTAWNDTVGAVGGVVDFLQAALWLVNPLNWLRAFEALVGVTLIAASIAIFVGADKLTAPGGGAGIPLPPIPE